MTARLEYLQTHITHMTTSDIVRTVMWMQTSAVSLPIGIPEPELFKWIRAMEGEEVAHAFVLVCRELDMRIPASRTADAAKRAWHSS